MDEELIELKDEEVVEIIEIDESIGWTTGDGNRHRDLSDRNEHDQHIIESISGLREELDEIEKIKTVYSDKIGIANYYAWPDGVKRDEYGYFVSLKQGTSTVDICDGTDIFGVTVDGNAVGGFVGGQSTDLDNPRDNSYALVATLGLVNVRCSSGVNAGDYVICEINKTSPTGIAVATESGCGYKVISTNYINETKYATISLGVQACTTDALGANIRSLDDRIKGAIANLNSINHNVGTMYDEITSIKGSNEQVKDKADEAWGKADAAEKNTASAVESMGEALGKVTKAQTAAEAARSEAVKTADDALAGVKYVGGKLTDFIANVDKYSVGEHSQSYLLTVNQARDILEDGIVYIPIGDQSIEEAYVYESAIGKTTFIKSFTPGYYYTWKDASSLIVDGVNYGGGWWQEHSNRVNFDGTPPSFSICDYWFPSIPIVDEYEQQYKQNVLYAQEQVDDEEGNTVTKWVEQVSLDGNMNNRLFGAIRSTTNSMNVELSNARGDAVTLQERLDADGARFSLTASKVTEINGKKLEAASKVYESFEALNSEVTADNVNTDLYYLVGTTLPYDVYQWGSTKDETGNTVNRFVKHKLLYHDGVNFCRVNSAAIIGSVNNDESSLKFSADKIDFEAKNYTISANNIDFNAKDYTIHANKIDFATEGLEVKNNDNDTTFSVDQNGDVFVKGNIEASSGEIGGWTISEDELSNGCTGVYAGDSNTHQSLWGKNNNGVFVDSPVRFYAGDTSNTDIEYSGELIFNSEDELTELTQSINLDSTIAIYYRISDAEVLTSNVLHKDKEYISTVTITSDSVATSGTEETQYAITNVALGKFLPENLSSDQYEVALEYNSETGDSLHVEYSQDGTVTVCGWLASGGTAKDVTVRATIHEYEEELNVRCDVNENGSQINVILTPHVKNAEYKIAIKYFIESKSGEGYQFKVLDDGSLYASAVNIKGQIEANKGEIGGWQITENCIENEEKTVGLFSDKSPYTMKSIVDENVEKKVSIGAGRGLYQDKVVVPCDISNLIISTTYESSSYLIESVDIESAFCSGTRNSDIVAQCIGLVSSSDLCFETRINVEQCESVDIIGFSYDPYEDGEVSYELYEQYCYYDETSKEIVVGGFAPDNCGHVTFKFHVKYKYSESCSIKSDPYIEIYDDNKAVDIAAEVIPTTSYKQNDIESCDVTLNITTNLTGVKFAILEDGSLYAEAANIRGNIYADNGVFNGTVYATNGEFRGKVYASEGEFIGKITATDGTFSGTINANDGKIGPLVINENSILSEATNIEISTNGNIAADSIRLNKDLQTQIVKGYPIRLDNTEKTPQLMFGGYVDTEKANYYELSYAIESTGYAIGSSYVEGSVTVTLKTGAPISLPRRGCITATYRDTHTVDTLITYDKVYYPNIPNGFTETSFSIPYRTNARTILVGVRFSDAEANLIVQAGHQVNFTEKVLYATDAIFSNVSFLPTTDTPLSLGADGAPWHDVWVHNINEQSCSICTSDRDKKNTIVPVDAKYSKLFDTLNPVTFKYNNGTSGRTHLGFIAQELKDSMDACDIDSQDFAAYCSWEDSDGNETCGIRYEEFVPLNIYETQKLKQRVRELEEKLLALEERLNNQNTETTP